MASVDCAAAALATLALRALVIGRPPYTDEGVHAAIGYLSHFGGADHPNSLLALYPRAVAWVFAIPVEPFHGFTILRGIDALAAAAGSVLILLLARQWVSRFAALLGALFWAVAFNHPVFIDGGFKNSISVSTALIAMAFLLLARTQPKPILAGIAAGAAIAFREPFVFALAPVFYLGWDRLGKLGAVRIGAGLAVVAAAVFLLLLAEGHGPIRAAEYYFATSRQYSALLEATESSTWSRLDAAFARALPAMLWLLPLTAVGIGFVIGDIKTKSRRPIGVVALLLIAAHVPELGIYPVAYHFAQFAFGLALLAAEGVHRAGAALPSRLSGRALRAAYAASAALLFAMLLPYSKAATSPWKESLRFWPVMVGNAGWDSDLVNESFYLKLASEIRQAPKPAEARTLMTSGYYMALYPLTERAAALPSAPDLTAETFRGELRGSDAQARLRSHAPDIYVQSSRFAPKLGDYYSGFKSEYQPLSEIGTGGHGPYRDFGAQVFIRIPAETFE